MNSIPDMDDKRSVAAKKISCVRTAVDKTVEETKKFTSLGLGNTSCGMLGHKGWGNTYMEDKGIETG